jgi:thiol-disulfide isomerase/thioredoxin
VSADLRARRTANATPAPPFTLPAYPDGRRVSLADYAGRVVLINFWYPSCGPCRAELPRLQRVLETYQGRGFVLLAVNVVPEEKDLAISYVARNGFGFLALGATGEWAESTYGVASVPSSVLVDAEGRVVLRPGLVTSQRQQRSLELQIESLLR